MKEGLAIRKPVGTAISYDCTLAPIDNSTFQEIDSAIDAAASAILVSNTSTQPVRLATGASGAEVEIGAIPPGATEILMPVQLKNGSRFSAKSDPAQASSGYLVVSFFQ